MGDNRKANPVMRVENHQMFRVMGVDGDRPSVGPVGYTLGVRLPPDPNADVVPDGQGQVVSKGGMSVAPSKDALRSHQVPKRLRVVLNRPDARGRDDRSIWRHGEGRFVQTMIGEDLELIPDPGRAPTHGVVQPSRPMPLSNYVAALEGTRDGWSVDE